ncbi:sensor histidine kinase [Amycolatopsis ultiminotia]|uniref:sensor histidine kinase n=1 Tax=Amycolatopsis ultiminotia TaxID=543629 RepID=UPI0031E67236
MGRRDSDGFSMWQWPDWSFWEDRRGGKVNRARVAALVVNGTAVLFLFFHGMAIADGDNGALRTGVALGLLGGYGLSCVLALWYGPVSPPRTRIAFVAVLFTLGSAPTFVLGAPHDLTDLTYAIAIGLTLLPLRYSLLLGPATVLGQIGWSLLGDGTVHWAAVLTLVLVTVFLGSILALNFTIGHLRVAREQVKRMAVTEERERVARDLHDILGHSLSTMTVKLGLARRILESADDIGPAVSEIRELEGLSRQALSDVRATVSGYRTVTLATEIAGARIALRAAGVRAELPTVADDVPSELQPVFGYVVREAVTNVLRHSDAQSCTIRLGHDWVEISDNGTDVPETTAGHGLTGLAERLAAVSGTVEHGRCPGGGFRVLARGPASPAEAGPR